MRCSTICLILFASLYESSVLAKPLQKSATPYYLDFISKIKILRQMKMCSQVARLIFLLQVNRIQNFTSNETFLIKNLLKSQVVPRVVLGMENGMA